MTVRAGAQPDSLDGVSDYSDEDRQRMLPEEHSSRRSDFARDRARLFHSSALRRLAAKTQVLSPTAGFDVARNRLTHSLEVAQIGRELAQNLGLDPDVVDTACLAHDLGHPPFGHNGEKALDEWSLSQRGASASTGENEYGFEGNAQTLRVLTRLEAKVFGSDDRSYGLNLTRASLDASCKYPWSRGQAVSDPSGRVKYGFYPDDEAVFRWLRAGAPDGVPCVEAQVMDLSDDIAYSVHDFEDSVVNGFVNVAELNASGGRQTVIRGATEWAGDEFAQDEIEEAFDRVAALPPWLRTYDHRRATQAQLKNFTSQLIGRFVTAATAATKESYPATSLARFGASVVVPRQIEAEIAVLKGISATFVMSRDTRQPLYQRQKELLTALADALLAGASEDLEQGFRDDWSAAGSDATRVRVVVDQVANLTDPSAITWFERLVGR